MKIFVLGGGFAGVEAAINLRKKGYQVSLISDRDYLFIYPVSIWIPVGKRSFEDTKLNLNKLAVKHGFELIIDKIVKIETESNTLFSDQNSYNYDYLFLANGMGKTVVNGIENTNSICGNPEESLVIKNKIEKIIAKGSGAINIGFGANPKDKGGSSLRGGPAFELLFNISVLLKKKRLTDKVELTFFAPMAEPGKRMGDNAFSKMDKFFKRYKVKTHFGKNIKEFREDKIFFEDDTYLNSDLTMYISGGQGSELIQNSNFPKNEAGFVFIDDYCQVADFDNVYAIGDVAALPELPYAAKQGHVAEIMANVSVKNFHYKISGMNSRVGYAEKLEIICLMDSGDGAALVKRTADSEFLLPLPVIGHWLKMAWGWYYINTKMKRMFRIPGM